MNFVDKCINTFLTTENIKNYIEYVIDNDIFLTDKCYGSLMDVFVDHDWHKRFVTHFVKNEGTFYDAIIHTLISKYDVKQAYGDIGEQVFHALCKYPNFVEHVKFVCTCDEKTADEIWQTNRAIIRKHDVKPQRRSDADGLLRSLISVDYYALAFHDFLEHDNIKQYLFYLFENPDERGRQMLCDYLFEGYCFDEFSTIAYFQREFSRDWYLCNYDYIFHTTFYHMFAKLWHIERNEMKNALVNLHEQTYDGFAEHCNTNANIDKIRVFANDYVLWCIYRFL